MGGVSSDRTVRELKQQSPALRSLNEPMRNATKMYVRNGRTHAVHESRSLRLVVVAACLRVEPVKQLPSFAELEDEKHVLIRRVRRRELEAEHAGHADALNPHLLVFKVFIKLDHVGVIDLRAWVSVGPASLSGSKRRRKPYQFQERNLIS